MGQMADVGPAIAEPAPRFQDRHAAPENHEHANGDQDADRKCVLHTASSAEHTRDEGEHDADDGRREGAKAPAIAERPPPALGRRPSLDAVEGDFSQFASAS